ncbi:hypothetical protein LCGC14_1332390 [marine sediment metagenome]|uniref:Uncharacterized protein n=1 Tax=marine sediment metagenome TaxID=412755 RepID=A0A0F9MWZ3_9ZZZZ
MKRKLLLFKDREEIQLWKEFIKYNKIKYFFLILIGFLLGFNLSIIMGIIW